MKKILIVGSGGQIGTELVKKLRRTYGNENVVASDLRPLTGEIVETGPFERIDSTQIMQIVDVVKRYNIDTIYNLAAILSATAEKNPMLGWNVAGLECRHRLFGELPRDGPYLQLRRLHAFIHRRFRCQHAARQHASRHHSTPEYHLRCDQGHGRVVERLLLPSLWRGYP